MSSSLISADRKCDVYNYALYTNVLKFKDWIDDPKQESVRFATELQAHGQAESQQNCGVMGRVTSMIQKGSTASRTLFPWTVAVYEMGVNEIAVGHLDTGTLISERHVVVVASFVTYSDYSLIPTTNFRMYFGAFDLDQKTSSDVIQSGVSKIILNENYKWGQPQEANVAILVASKPVKFSLQVQPICLWPENFDDAMASVGFAAGWGYDESKTHSKFKKYAQMKIENMQTCESFWGDQLSSVVFSNFFCAISLSGGAPCYSDEPFYVKSKEKWFLRGLLALINYSQINGTCSVTVPVLYEDVKPHLAWMKSVISSP